jgi:hypothetical protein
MFLGFVGLSSMQFYGYLFERMGYPPFRIGLLLSTGLAAGIAAPIFQVQAIRFLKGPRRALFLMLAGAGLALAGLPHVNGFFPMMAVFFIAMFCASGFYPLITACALEVTRSQGPWVYFVVRCLGTLGFLAGCFASYFYPGPALLSRLYLGFGAAFLFALIIALWGLRPSDPGEAPEDGTVNLNPRHAPGFGRALRLLSAPRPRQLLWALGIMNFANSMATLVQGNYLVARFPGGTQSISLAWIVSTACEVPFMLLCAWLTRCSALRVVMGLGLLGTTLKLVLIGTAATRGMYFLGLIFHGCFFSGAMVGFNLYVDQHFSVADRPSLQALGALFYQGIPMALGGLAAGLIWHFAGLRDVYWTAAAIGMGVGVYTLFLLPRLPGFPGRGGFELSLFPSSK